MSSNSENLKLRPVGRPQQEMQVRDALILQARTLFIAKPYEKVSTRMIANGAGVNMGMIRYYFNHKAGLFETMLRDTLKPFKDMIAEPMNAAGGEFLVIYMKEFYRVMSKYQNFPRFVARTMQSPFASVERKIMEKVMMEHIGLMRERSHNELSGAGVRKGQTNITFAQFTILNLMLFPFLAPPEMLKMHDITVDDEFLSDLIEHNIQLLSQGIINSHDT